MEKDDPALRAIPKDNPAPRVQVLPAQGEDIVILVSFPYKPVSAFILWQWDPKTNDWRLVKQTTLVNPNMPMLKFELKGVPPPAAQGQPDLKIAAVYTWGTYSAATVVHLPRAAPPPEEKKDTV